MLPCTKGSDHIFTKSSDMLNKNTLGVKKVQGQKEAVLPSYVRPKSVISAEAKKLLYKKS